MSSYTHRHARLWLEVEGVFEDIAVHSAASLVTFVIAVVVGDVTMLLVS